LARPDAPGTPVTYPALSIDAARYGPVARTGASYITAMDVLVFLAGLTCILIYSPAWAAPLTGYKPGAADAALLRNGMIPAHLAGLFLLAISWQRVWKAFFQNWLLVALVGLTVSSFLWSIDPATSLRRGIALILITLGGFGLAGRFRLTALTELLATGFGLIALMSMALGLFAPSWGRMTELFPGAWRGVYLEKNALGGMMSIGIICALASAIYVPKRRLLWLASAGLCLALVVLSQSKTALVAVALTLCILGMIWMVRRGPVTAVAGLWIGAVGVMALVALFLFAPDLAFKAVGKDATLTGRTEIWTAAWRQLMNGRQMLGFGYGVLWDHTEHWYPAAKIAQEAKFIAGHAHNGWLETTLSTGFVGLTVWALYFLQTWSRAAVRMFQGGGAYLILPFLAVFSVRTMTEVSVLDYQDLLWLIFIALAVKLGMGEQR
jgi:O-antigen ligase